MSYASDPWAHHSPPAQLQTQNPGRRQPPRANTATAQHHKASFPLALPHPETMPALLRRPDAFRTCTGTPRTQPPQLSPPAPTSCTRPVAPPPVESAAHKGPQHYNVTPTSSNTAAYTHLAQLLAPVRCLVQHRRMPPGLTVSPPQAHHCNTTHTIWHAPVNL